MQVCMLLSRTTGWQTPNWCLLEWESPTKRGKWTTPPDRRDSVLQPTFFFFSGSDNIIYCRLILWTIDDDEVWSACRVSLWQHAASWCATIKNLERSTVSRKPSKNTFCSLVTRPRTSPWLLFVRLFYIPVRIICTISRPFLTSMNLARNPHSFTKRKYSIGLRTIIRGRGQVEALLRWGKMRLRCVGAKSIFDAQWIWKWAKEPSPSPWLYNHIYGSQVCPCLSVSFYFCLCLHLQVDYYDSVIGPFVLTPAYGII